jgi:flagellar basal body P-ring protein FlgI
MKPKKEFTSIANIKQLFKYVTIDFNKQNARSQQQKSIVLKLPRQASEKHLEHLVHLEDYKIRENGSYC